MANYTYVSKDKLLYFKTLVAQLISDTAAGKVDKVSGMGLSHSDYTAAEKTKLASVATNANNYSLPSANGTTKGGVTLSDSVASTSGASAAVAATPAAVKAANDAAVAAQSTASANATAIAGKVDKVSGKGLSTNDYTTTEKNKLAGIATGAQANIIEAIQVNGVTQTATSKTINISVPTDYITAGGLSSALSPYAKTSALPTKVSQLSNDSGYQNATQVSSAISTAIAGVTTFSFVIVTSLPTTGESNHIYLVKKSSAATNNAYEEYAYINSKWELIGSTDVDLSGYLKTNQLVEITNAEIDAMFA